MLSCLADVVNAATSDNVEKSKQRENESAGKLLVTTLEDILAQAEGDKHRVVAHNRDYAKWRDTIALKEHNYVARLRKKGAEAAEQFVSSIAMSHAHFSSDSSASVTRPTQYQNLVNTSTANNSASTNDRSAVLHVLDYVLFACVDKKHFQSSVSTAGMMAMNSDDHAIVYIHPQACVGSRYSGDHAITHGRSIEDLLLKTGLDLSTRSVMTFAAQDHNDDRRSRSQWCTLAVKDTKSNVFKDTPFAKGLGGGNVSLVRTRDMVLFEGANTTDSNSVPTNVTKEELTRGKKQVQPSERARQRGTESCMAVLKDFMQGVDIPPNGIIHVVVWNPNHANDWQMAAMQLQLNTMTANAPTPDIPQKVISTSFAETREMQEYFHSVALDEVYALWYDGKINLAGAGRCNSKTIKRDDLPPPPETPALKIGYLATTANPHSFTLGFPTAVVSKFSGNDGLADRFASFTAGIVKELGEPAVQPKQPPKESDASRDSCSVLFSFSK